MVIRLRSGENEIEPPKEGYSTEPPFKKLLRMENITEVHDFKIYNEHGSIAFLNPVDLTQADLGSFVISQRGVSAFEDCEQPPAPGKGLNQPARIVLKCVKPPKNKSAEQYGIKLQKSLEKDRATFVSYTSDFVWTFEVPSF